MGTETPDAIAGRGLGRPTGPGGAPAEPRVVVAGNELTVFVEWPALRQAMLADIAAAQHRIWVETYIFAGDAGATQVAEALKARARAGVDVRVLYDAIGSERTRGVFFAEMQAVGVRVKAFHSIWEALAQGRRRCWTVGTIASSWSWTNGSAIGAA